jgi:hypothetical protein
MLDIDRFTKVLALAGSNHDGEALAALRKARSMLASAKLLSGDLAGLGCVPDRLGVFSHGLDP